jgi:signal transduction histidine kinase
MSYRSFKRVLGESSLERKCLFLFGACLLLLITGSFWWAGQPAEELVYEQNREIGRLLVYTSMLLEHWQKLETNNEFRPVIPEIVKSIRDQDYDWRVIRRSVDGEDQPKDEREWAILDQLEKQPPPSFLERADAKPPFAERYVRIGDRGEYQYYQPIYVKGNLCVSCHRALTGPPDLADGDVLAVVQVSMSDAPTHRALSLIRAIRLSTAIVTVFLAMIAVYIIIRYIIVKPLKHLRDVSNEIRRGNYELRAEIRTGDEFEELGVAFNRMLRHLVAVQEELRHVNADLDSKVDELAQVNMQLFEMNRLKSDFLATMSHELRTPLNSIIGFSEVLGSISSLDEKQKRYVQNIQKSGKVLLDMINDILDLAKIESGKMEIRLSDFRIEHVIGALCDMARPLTERKNIDLDADTEPALPRLHQDQGKVQQILNNLLSNAIKFTPEGGRIVISAQADPDGECLVLSVADTGVGIAEEDRVAIFEKFRQGQSALPAGDAMTREYSGTGLGLSIVKELCKLLGGEISLESELGKGSTFTVRLPWVRSDRPRLDSPLAEGLEDLTKPRRIDFEQPRLEPVSAAGSEE